MEYTKGEWNARQWFTSNGIEGFTTERNNIIIARDVHPFNASLVAAALDLYEALKEMLNYFNEREIAPLIKWREALAKAEGK